jgi:hypothetical protein
LFPGIQGTLEDDPNGFIIAFYLTAFSQVAAAALFAIAFVSMARATHSQQISYYMYVTSYGLVLFFIGIGSTVSGTGYPPFGLPTVSLVGPFSFLFFIGLNHSAIAIAEDSNLRRSIKVSTQHQLKLLRSMGDAEMQSRLEKTVLDATKANAERLSQQTGIEPSLSMEEVKQYINEVLAEIKKPMK